MPPREHRARAGDQPIALPLLLAGVVGEQRAQEAGQAIGVGLGRRLGQERRQVGAQQLGGRVALLALHGQRAQDDAVELRRDAAADRRRRNDLRVARARHGVGVWLVGRAGDREELAPGQELPEHDPGRVDVDAAIERLPARLLGRQIGELAVDDPGRGPLHLEDRHRQPEVGQLHLAGVREQHVGRRDVAVDQLEVFEGVRVDERPGDLLDDVDRDVDREGDPLVGAAVPGRQQVLAVDVLHRQEDLSPLHAGVEHADHVAVREAHRDQRLVVESSRVLRGPEVGDDLLDHAELFEAGRPGQRKVKLPHPPAGERLQEHVVVKPSRKPALSRHGGDFTLRRVGMRRDIFEGYGRFSVRGRRGPRGRRRRRRYPRSRGGASSSGSPGGSRPTRRPSSAVCWSRPARPCGW